MADFSRNYGELKAEILKGWNKKVTTLHEKMQSNYRGNYINTQKREY